jgi:hypothetical protein
MLTANLRSSVLVAAATLAFFAFIGCSSNTPTSPGKDLQVTNATDNFQFQVTNVRNYTNAYQYSWTNTGTVATVNQASAVTGGTAVLTIRDNAGTQVYSQSVAQNGTFDTAAGIAGTWTIVLNLTKTSGTINFRVQKKI